METIGIWWQPWLITFWFYTNRASAWCVFREMREREREREKEREAERQRDRETERERERVERERERERDRSDVTIVVLKLVRSLHFPLQKHFSFLLAQMITVVALKLAISSHFPLQNKKKKIFALLVPTFSMCVTGDRKTEDEWPDLWLHRPTQALDPFSQRKNWIKSMPKTIGHRKRDCAWGCAFWVINIPKKNLQTAKHKIRKAFIHWTALWFAICRFSQEVVITPSATSCKISFSISNSFWH